jgi:uncharacterized protein (DUF2147 family)
LPWSFATGFIEKEILEFCSSNVIKFSISMMKKILLLLTFCTALFAQEIKGLWKTVDENTGHSQCVLAIYPYQGKYYGRIIGTYDEKTGKMTDTIYDPKGRAEGVPGNPFYCGLDILWDLIDRGSKYKGKIVDPRKGNVYKAEVWVEGGNLIVRGKWLFLGRSQTWLPTTDADFPAGFKKPDTSKFVPVIPDVD